MKKTIVVVAAGPGVGNHVAKEFGIHGFQVILLARNEMKLKRYREEMQENGITCHYKVVDCKSVSSLTCVFDEIQNTYGVVDVLMYNGAVLKPKPVLELTSEYLMECLQVDVASAMHCVNQVVDKQIERQCGTILFTGGGFGVNPVPEYSTISIGKASLRALSIMLHEELKDKGIYVGIVNIMGSVAEGTYYNPSQIAKKYYEMYCHREMPEHHF